MSRSLAGLIALSFAFFGHRSNPNWFSTAVDSGVGAGSSLVSVEGGGGGGSDAGEVSGAELATGAGPGRGTGRFGRRSGRRFRFHRCRRRCRGVGVAVRGVPVPTPSPSKPSCLVPGVSGRLAPPGYVPQQMRSWSCRPTAGLRAVGSAIPRTPERRPLPERGRESVGPVAHGLPTRFLLAPARDRTDHHQTTAVAAIAIAVRGLGPAGRAGGAAASPSSSAGAPRVRDPPSVPPPGAAASAEKRPSRPARRPTDRRRRERAGDRYGGSVAFRFRHAGTGRGAPILHRLGRRFLLRALRGHSSSPWNYSRRRLLR